MDSLKDLIKTTKSKVSKRNSRKKTVKKTKSRVSKSKSKKKTVKKTKSRVSKRNSRKKTVKKTKNRVAKSKSKKKTVKKTKSRVSKRNSRKKTVKKTKSRVSKSKSKKKTVKKTKSRVAKSKSKKKTVKNIGITSVVSLISENLNEKALPIIYLSTKDRMNMLKYIRNEFKDTEKRFGKQCINSSNPKDNTLKNIILTNKLGRGTFGSVYEGCSPIPCDDESFRYAVKFTLPIKPTDYKKRNKLIRTWHEYYILNNYLKPLIKENICPNFPLLLKTFTCNNCNFDYYNDPSKFYTNNCIIYLTELGSGTMNDWFKTNPSDDELYCAFFQVLAATHVLQIKTQIVNTDIKAENILYYNVKPGGYWCYKIHGKNFYVPNYGKLFILNDYGVAQIVNPFTDLLTVSNKYKPFKLEGVIIDGMISPFQTVHSDFKDKAINIRQIPNTSWWKDKIENYYIVPDDYVCSYKPCPGYVQNNKIYNCNINFTVDQIRVLSNNDIPLNPKDKRFFNNELIPYDTFGIDTQDCVRTFLGGKQVVQPGSHLGCTSDSVKNNLQKYSTNLFKYNSIIKFVKASFYVAGYLLEDFFTTQYNLTVPKGEIIETYNIS